MIRTSVAMVVALVALQQHSLGLLVVAYATYWVGDMLDGKAARHFDQETRIGAVFDIVSDRACTVLCAAAFVAIAPESIVPITIFLLQFCVVDTMLSLSFLCFPVKSPNYFYEVDRTVYRWNWSPLAKATNTSAVVLLTVTGFTVPAAVCACLVLATKIWSCWYLIGSVWPRGASPQAEQVGAR